MHHPPRLFRSSSSGGGPVGSKWKLVRGTPAPELELLELLELLERLNNPGPPLAPWAELRWWPRTVPLILSKHPTLVSALLPPVLLLLLSPNTGACGRGKPPTLASLFCLWWWPPADPSIPFTLSAIPRFSAGGAAPVRLGLPGSRSRSGCAVWASPVGAALADDGWPIPAAAGGILPPSSSIYILCEWILKTKVGWISSMRLALEAKPAATVIRVWVYVSYTSSTPRWIECRREG